MKYLPAQMLKQTPWRLCPRFVGTETVFSAALPTTRLSCALVPLFSLASPASACGGFQSHPLLPPSASSLGQSGALLQAKAVFPRLQWLPWSCHAHPAAASSAFPADPAPALHPLTPTTLPPSIFSAGLPLTTGYEPFSPVGNKSLD